MSGRTTDAHSEAKHLQTFCNIPMRPPGRAVHPGCGVSLPSLCSGEASIPQRTVSCEDHVAVEGSAIRRYLARLGNDRGRGQGRGWRGPACLALNSAEVLQVEWRGRGLPPGGDVVLSYCGGRRDALEPNIYTWRFIEKHERLTYLVVLSCQSGASGGCLDHGWQHARTCGIGGCMNTRVRVRDSASRYVIDWTTMLVTEAG
jgi:hypothetical protein